MARRYIHVHVSVSAEEEVCAFCKPLPVLCHISATNRALEDLSETLDPDLSEDPEVLLDMYACTNQCSLQDKGSLTYYSLNLKKPFHLKLHHKHMHHWKSVVNGSAIFKASRYQYSDQV